MKALRLSRAWGAWGLTLLSLGACAPASEFSPREGQGTPPTESATLMPRDAQPLPHEPRPVERPETRSEGAPQNRAIFFGGNCEIGRQRPDFVNDNMFTKTFADKSAKFAKAGWQIRILFGTEGTLRVNQDWLDDSAPAESLKTGSFANLLQALDEALGMPKGSQVLLYVMTHGSPERKEDMNGKMRGHSICVSEGERDNLSVAMNDPDLVLRFKNLSEAGVKLAVVDESCFSGATVGYLSPYACVVAQQSANRSAWGTIQMSEFEGSVSMEDLFLREQTRGYKLNFPMINGFDLARKTGEALARWMEPASSGNAADDNIAAFWNRLFDASHEVSADPFLTLADEAEASLNSESSESVFADAVARGLVMSADPKPREISRRYRADVLRARAGLPSLEATRGAVETLRGLQLAARYVPSREARAFFGEALRLGDLGAELAARGKRPQLETRESGTITAVQFFDSAFVLFQDEGFVPTPAAVEALKRGEMPVFGDAADRPAYRRTVVEAWLNRLAAAGWKGDREKAAALLRAELWRSLQAATQALPEEARRRLNEAAAVFRGSADRLAREASELTVADVFVRRNARLLRTYAYLIWREENPKSEERRKCADFALNPGAATAH